MTATRKPGARVRRGLITISSEMSVYADCKQGEGVDGKHEADDVRAALAYIDAQLVQPLGHNPTPTERPLSNA